MNISSKNNLPFGRIKISFVTQTHTIMKKIFIFLSLIAFFSSCETEESTESYHGEWFLVAVENPFINETTNYEPGQIIWDFDTTNQIIEVTNNTEEEVVLSAGFHAYSLGEHPCNYFDYDFITAGEEQELGVFDLQSLGADQIKINYSCLDGSILYLKK